MSTTTDSNSNSPSTSIRKSFRNIRLIVLLLLGFVLVQGYVTWRVCTNGMGAMSSLQSEGLPSLQHVGALQEDLALFRLHSLEWIFAQEADKPAKAKRAEEVRKQAVGRIASLKKLFTAGDVQTEVTKVEKAFTELVAGFEKVRSLLDADFPGAMKSLDQDVPAKVTALADTTGKLQKLCLAISSTRADNTVIGFTQIQNTTFGFGAAGVGMAGLAAILVTILASRTRRTMVGIVGRLNTGSNDVTAAAERLFTSSQSVAGSSSNQAASVEETSASMEEIRSMVQRNTENATTAKTLAFEARSAAEAGAKDMAELSKAMEEIKTSSDSISKILKSIDEIAFQTNILALNAAVEAARAGEAGLGFAVVAEEVRNLAQRSASAARETADSIDDSLRRTSRGVEISGRVAGSLSEIVKSARKVDDLVGEIAAASTEQSRGIDQINVAMVEIDKVTQATAAEADHSAQDSKLLSEQATGLRDAVADLVRLADEKIPEATSDASEDPAPSPQKPAPAPIPSQARKTTTITSAKSLPMPPVRNSTPTKADSFTGADW